MPPYGAPNSTTTFNTQPGANLKVNQGLTVGWREFISKTGSTQKYRWNQSGSSIEMVIDSAFSDRLTLAAQTIGVPSVIGSSLSRYLPMPHPDYPWMYGTGFAMDGVNWQSKVTSGYGAFSGYDINRTYITFSILPFNVLSDNDAAMVGVAPQDAEGNLVEVFGEWNRFVVKSRKPTTEFATVQSNQMQWPDGTNPASIPAIPKATTFSQSFGVKQQATTITLKWMWVPETYLFNYNGDPANIENALGTVNRYWWGFYDAGISQGYQYLYPPQTLYFDSVDYEPEFLPVNPTAVPPYGLGYQVNRPPRVWNVTMYFKFFNPPKDPNWAGYVITSGTRKIRIGGHNLIPNTSQPLLDANGVPTGGFYFYPIFSKSGNNTLYKATSFANIFANSSNVASQN